MKKKEILTLFQSTPLSSYYVTQYQGYYFVLEKLSLGEYGLLTTLNKPSQELVNQLIIHHDFIKDGYLHDKEMGFILKRTVTIEQIKNILNHITDVFEEKTVHHVCSICHQEKEVELTCDDEVINISCSTCFNQQVKRTHPSNLPLGLIGTFIGCLLPAFLWIYLHDIGYWVIIDGVFVALGSFVGYQKLGHYMDKKGLVSSFALATLMMIIAQVITFGYEIVEVFQTNFKVKVTLAQSMVVLPEFIRDGEVLGVTAGYFIGLLLWMGIGYVFLYRLYRKKHGHQNIFEKIAL